MACRADDAQGPVTLVLLDLQQTGVQRTGIAGIDLFRTTQARIACIDAAAEPLAPGPSPAARWTPS